VPNALQEHLLTVLIPNYNYADYVADAIESIYQQDYPAIELIVVDDGSSDDSVAVATKKLAETNNLQRTKLVALENNRGKLGAINAVLDELKGEYLITLDADDWLTPGYASRCIKELQERRQEDPNLGFIYSDCNLADQQMNIIERGRSVAFDKELVEQASYLPEPALTDTRAFLEVAPFDESIRVATKHHKWKRMVANGWTGFHIAEPLFNYRMHDGNLSGIGDRILGETALGDYGERLLSGYWQVARG